ncbi:hypothetical protein L6164_000891 [Bauhinia variegata]|uniref:Uncharacterized protein n=1 Tax=Bauhinia variegata TaxID=167791 RepID=A0ACB9Q789_BAUVA|nr:hypothetical protein L6164_000891 [Bauhinia variegata]
MGSLVLGSLEVRDSTYQKGRQQASIEDSDVFRCRAATTILLPPTNSEDVSLVGSAMTTAKAKKGKFLRAQNVKLPPLQR